ncbi:HAUS augmin-like complex subunit 1 [Protopterus annectens]|uniref:HAUS augmin-like complex subunit 1 n=1 Tax=Protopterus annectens TaxID=7888 RepID=UPI001CFB7A54|nr:HAUS augmin-like complex subunit 1 [Protopterus annectens]
MEEKIGKVALWLKKVFGNQPVPDYEVDTRTVDILYQLAELNTARDKDFSLVIEDLKQKTSEYALEANYLQGLLLESAGLSFSSLSSNGCSYLNTMKDSALVLNLRDSSERRYLYAVEELEKECLTTEEKIQKLDQELTSLRCELTKTLVLEKSLQEDLKKTEEQQVVERAKAENRIKNMEFLSAKSDDFRFKIRVAEEQLTASGFDKTLSHHSLVDLSEKLTMLRQEIRPLKKQLESYLDLTPNPSLAKVKIEEAKRELEALGTSAVLIQLEYYDFVTARIDMTLEY